jgi:very-short-patch-repair endonuclease
MISIDDRAAAIARRQHGLITRRQARDAGISADAIQTRLRSMRWVSVEPGVYIINGAPLTPKARLLAACIAFDGFASHRSDAALLDLDGYRLDIIELSIPRGRHVKRDDIVFHESTDLDRFEPIWLDGIPATPPERLAVDLGAVVPFARFDRTVDEMIRRRLFSWPEAYAQLVRHSRRGRNGVGALRALLDLRYEVDPGDSHLEDAFLRELRRRRFPEPVLQLSIFDANGIFIARVDCAYPYHRIAIEIDSRKHHGAPQFEADRLKRDRLTAEGWAVQEITRDMLFRDAAGVFRRLERLLERTVWDGPSISQFSGGRWPAQN